MYTAVYLLSFAVFLFYFKKDFLHNIPLLFNFSSQSISKVPSFNKLYWDFLRHFLFSFNTEFFHLSHLANLPLCIITKFTYLFFSTQLIFLSLRLWALSIQFSSYFLINNVIIFDLVLNFETQTMSQILELI